METNRWIAAALCCCSISVYGQDWNTGGNNITGGGQYLGCDATSNQPLRFTKFANYPQQWRTNNTLRMRLLETNTTQTIGSYLNQTVSGNLGVGPFTNPNVSLPFSLLHLDNGGSQFSGYRPWFRPGMTATNSSDLGWIGLKNEGGDINHMTIAWADNTAVDGPDLFKVVFLANPGTTGTAGTLNGLETMRIQPLASGLQSYVGIGDFFTPGLNPTERFHILNGRARIQQLPDDPEAGDEYRVMVVDNSNTIERGVVKWKDLGTLTDCDWTRDVTTNFDVCTAFQGNSCPPDETKRVGVGVQYPKAKLQVYAHDPQLFSGDATLSILQHDQLGGRGVSGAARSVFTSTFNPSDLTGVSGTAENGRFSIGVRGNAVNACASPGHASILAGLWGEARGCENADLAIGVYGRAAGASSGQNFAAWFDGFGYISSGIWVPSDSTLKSDITDITAADATQRLMTLEPKSYTYNTAAHPDWHLPEGQQFGFLAQDLAVAYPHLVKNVIHPPIIDTAGAVIAEAEPITVVNLNGLLPEVVSVLQEQQRFISTLTERIGTLEQQVAACCNADHSGTRTMNGVEEIVKSSTADLLIVPNPVADLTELRYTTVVEGAVRLEVSDASGRVVLVRQEGRRSPGQFVYSWDTTALSAGTYHCTLYVDDQLVVRRAVKLDAR